MFAAGVLALVVLSLTGSGDYQLSASVNGDNAAPGIDALIHGHVDAYLARQPVMGLTSIVLRLPAAALASALGGDQLTIYKLGALACTGPLAAAAAWLIASPGLGTRRRQLRLLTVLVVMLSPSLRASLEGHPEDALTAVLATACVVAAMRGHTRWAATLLGLALGSKEWAVVAVVPVFLALPAGKRLEAAAIVLGLVALLCGLVFAGNPTAFAQGMHAETIRYLRPVSPLWPFASGIRQPGGGVLPSVRTLPWGLTRSQAVFVQLAVGGTLAVPWLLRVRSRLGRLNPLLLLALLGALRCICDTVDWSYYWLALVFPVAAWEATTNRAPVLTLTVSTCVWALFSAMGQASASLVFAAAMVGEAAIVVYLAGLVLRGAQEYGVARGIANERALGLSRDLHPGPAHPV